MPSYNGIKLAQQYSNNKGQYFDNYENLTANNGCDYILLKSKNYRPTPGECCFKLHYR